METKWVELSKCIKQRADEFDDMSSAQRAVFVQIRTERVPVVGRRFFCSQSGDKIVESSSEPGKPVGYRQVGDAFVPIEASEAPADPLPETIPPQFWQGASVNVDENSARNGGVLYEDVLCQIQETNTSAAPKRTSTQRATRYAWQAAKEYALVKMGDPQEWPTDHMQPFRDFMDEYFASLEPEKQPPRETMVDKIRDHDMFEDVRQRKPE